MSAPNDRWRATALLVAAASFMENLDGTILTTALPKMAVSLHQPAVRLNILITAYLVTLGVLIPISGWAADRVGARTVFIAAVAIFTLASGLCALSTSVTELVAARVLQGAGGAMMVPVGRLVVLRSTAKSDLVSAIAFLTWPALAAPAIAPALGGVLATYASWQWIFVINLPLGVLALLAATRLVPNVRDPTRRPLDLWGFVLTGAALALLVNAAETMTGQHIAWALTAGEFGLGTLLLCLAVTHLRRTRHPLLSLAAGRIPTFRIAILSGSLFRVAIGAAPFVFSLAFQDGLGWTPLHAGLVVISLFLGNLMAKPFTTPILRRYGFRRVLVLSASGVAVTLFMCADFDKATALVVILPVLFASGLFRSIGFTAYNTIVFADVPDVETSHANTLVSTVQQLTLGLGVAAGALAVRGGIPLDRLLGGTGSGLGPYAVAFVLLGLLPLGAALVAATLASDAGMVLMKD